METPNSSHTPGPWTSEDHYVHAEGLRFVAVSGGVSSCKESEAFANARLIAAAPELLEIAKAYRNLLRTSAHTDGEVATFHHIESVIAKATAV
jgi:hypothetical protein